MTRSAYFGTTAQSQFLLVKRHSVRGWFGLETPCPQNPWLLNAPRTFACVSRLQKQPKHLAVRTRVLPAGLSLVEWQDLRPQALFSRSSLLVLSSRQPVRGVQEVREQRPAWARNPEAGRSLCVWTQRRSTGPRVSCGSWRWRLGLRREGVCKAGPAVATSRPLPRAGTLPATLCADAEFPAQGAGDLECTGGPGWSVAAGLASCSSSEGFRAACVEPPVQLCPFSFESNAMNSGSSSKVDSDPAHRIRAPSRSALAHSAPTWGRVFSNTQAGEIDSWVRARPGPWGGVPCKAPSATGWWPGQHPPCPPEPLSFVLSVQMLLVLGAIARAGVTRVKRDRMARLVRGRPWLDCVYLPTVKGHYLETSLKVHSMPPGEDACARSQC